MADAVGERECLARLEDAHEFDGADKALLPHVADVGVLPEARCFLREPLLQRSVFFQRPVVAEDLQVRACRGAAERVAGVAVAVEEGLELGEFAENRNGPSSATQQGALCVPEPVTVSTAPLRTRLISFACAMVT